MTSVILITHAVGGAAVGVLFKSNPFLAFFTGFASHFLLDAIPHWDYPLQIFERNEKGKEFTPTTRSVVSALFITGLDCLSGFAIAAWATMHNPGLLLPALLGAVGGVLPDFLQFVYYIFPRSPLKYLQRFHMSVHTKKHLNNNQTFGISSQIAILIILAILTVK
jgi:hypothetical protein